MFEIAGGIIIAVIVLWILAAFWREILKVLGAFAVVYLFLGALLMTLFLGVECFHLLCFLIGRHAATAITDPIIAFTVIVGPWLFLMATSDDFDIPKAAFRWIRSLCRRSTWRAWWKRYRVVSGHHQPLFIWAHAPYLWLARFRKRSFPLSRVQRRVE